jgi:hypothetical protein
MSDVLRYRAPRESGGAAVDLSDLVVEVCESLELLSLRRRVALDVDVPPYTMVHGDGGSFRRLVEMLIAAALQATPGGRELVVTGGSDEADVTLEVADRRAVLAPRQEGEPVGEALVAVPEMRRLLADCGGTLRVAQAAAGALAWTLQVRRAPGAEADTRRAA